MRLSTTFLTVLITWVVLAVPSGAETFQAGFARVDITPQESVPMWGYGLSNRPENLSTGPHDPLAAAAVVVQAGESRLAMVGMDLGRAPVTPMVERIRQRIREEAGIDFVLLNGSHTHHGPALELKPTEENAVSRYYAQLEEKLVSAILNAAANLQDAKIGWASVDSVWNRNRHTKYEPVEDAELLVIRFDDLEGNLLGTVVNFAAHPTVRPPQSNQFSADFPGVMKRDVEGEYGGVCVFLQGAAGDIQPDYADANWGEPDYTDAPVYEIGHGLAKEAGELLAEIRTDVPSAPSIQGIDEDFAFATRLDFSDPNIIERFRKAYGERMVNGVVRDLRGNVIRPHLTTVLLNGDLAIVGMSGEFFCEHSLYLKRNVRDAKVLFIGYCNGHHFYFPTIKAAAEGGYGTSPAEAFATVGAGEQMRTRALINLYRLKGEL